MEEPKLKVGICKAKEISINLLDEYFIKGIGKVLYGRYKIIKHNNNVSVIDSGNNPIHTDTELILVPSKKNKNTFEIIDVTIGINFHWEQKETQRFCGHLQLVSEEEEVRVINHVDIEDYLLSVISSEMNASASEEYLKAHAIISRSWVLSRIDAENQEEFDFIDDNNKRIKWYGREEHTNFDVCADDHCQRYQGISRACTSTVKDAIKQTTGIVLYSDNKICDARFSKCCGGVSEDFENVWEDKKVSYLSAIIDSPKDSIQYDLTTEEGAKEWISKDIDAFCNVKDKKLLSTILNDYDFETSNFYRWKEEYTQEELSNLIKERSGIDFGLIKELKPLKRGRSGRIFELEIVGTKRSFIFGKELEIRKVLSESHLYSSAFFVETKGDEIPSHFQLIGAGWGHGVGLCQIGAAAMIDKGYNHEEVLKHYFLDSELKKIY